jgi:hypothetical protein
MAAAWLNVQKWSVEGVLDGAKSAGSARDSRIEKCPARVEMRFRRTASSCATRAAVRPYGAAGGRELSGPAPRS